LALFLEYSFAPFSLAPFIPFDCIDKRHVAKTKSKVEIN
jgi:hypothetical protein